MLAADNSTRSPRRAATAMIALTVGATLITGYSVVSASVESTLTRQLDEQYPIDYQINPQFAPELLPETAEAAEGTDAEGESEEALAEGMEGAEGAEGASEEAPAENAESTEGTAPETGEASGPYDGLAAVPASVRESLEASPVLETVIGERSTYVDRPEGPSLPVSTYSGARMGTDLPADTSEGDIADLGPGKVAVSESHAEGTGVGDTFTIPVEDGEDLSLEVIAVLEPMNTLWGAVLDEQDYSEAFPGISGDQALMVRGAEGAEAAEVREAVYDAVDPHPTLQVMSMAELRGQVSDTMDIAFYTIAAMLGLAILIAVFGISNTMALSVLERTRESALLRAMGLARGQLRRMLSVEAVLLCLIGAGVGILLGLVFGWAAVESALPNTVLSVPVGQIAAFIVIAILAGLLASVLPGRRAAGTSITGALASE